MTLIRMHRLAVAGAAIAAIVAPIRLLGGGEAPPAEQPSLPRAAAAVAIADAGGLSFALTAPPFSPGRALPGAPSETETASEAQPPPPPAPMLVGLVLGAGGRAVALARGANGETSTLSRGQAIDGWRLVSIGRSEAVFELGGTRHSARLDYGNRAAGSDSPGTAPAPQPPPSATFDGPPRAAGNRTGS